MRLQRRPRTSKEEAFERACRLIGRHGSLSPAEMLVPLLAGTVCLTLGLWLFHRSHADLGANWSITLEVLEKHRLVRQGFYRRVRHPMYAALLLYSVGQALVLPNFVAGLSPGVSMALLVALRIGPEERMMLEEFGEDYQEYMALTKRLVAGIW